MKLTITEALAEIKTLGKRIEKKEQFVLSSIIRPEMIKDPHKEGSDEVVARERQGIGDLRTRWVGLRQAIATANHATRLTIADTERSIGEWLIWRREVASGETRFVESMRATIMRKKQEITRLGTEEAPASVVVHADEGELAKQAEQYDIILGELDGKLSLLNATTFVEVAD